MAGPPLFPPVAPIAKSIKNLLPPVTPKKDPKSLNKMAGKTILDEILPEEVSKNIKERRVQNIIDVREYEEVAQGKIPGAHHIPLGELQDRIHEIEKDKEHIMVCRSGSRSGMAAEFLKE